MATRHGGRIDGDADMLDRAIDALDPVVALLSGRDSVVVMSSTPPRIFEIIANDGVFDLRDLGPGPWPGNGETRILGSFPSPAQAFDHLCQRNQWEWTHSLADDVC